MGLRCLLGHDFDAPETERERVEEGNEVVVTVREVKTCTRCGETQVVSENKEITSIDQLRETATGEPTDSPSEGDPEVEPSTGADAGETVPDDQWSADELSADSDDSAPADTGIDVGGDTSASGEEMPDSEPAADPEPASEAEPAADDDPIERGVADIIEQAEKDDDMLQSPEERTEPGADSETASESGDDEDDEAEQDVPVHPGQRSASAEDDGPDPESDDGVILDEADDSPPEEARKQWEEEASPEEVPDQDPTTAEPSSPDGEDAEIIDDETEQVADPDGATAEQRDTPSAVESEDAEIIDADPVDSGDDRTSAADAADTAQSGGASERETTEEGHMPWPDAPGEDEGHDATVPDEEPVDLEFDGIVAPDSSDSDSEPDSDDDDETAAAVDRANGHRTESGEPSDATTAPTANVDLERSSRDADMEYYCPECGLTRDVGNSSMRAGDICPECRKGYINEQQKAE